MTAATITPRATLTGHDEAVEQVAIAPDGTWLVTASAKHQVRTALTRLRPFRDDTTGRS